MEKGNKKYLYIILVLGFVCSLFISFRALEDPDVFWHIKTGEYIIAHGIPTHDPFSWYGIKNNLKWINHEWLFDCIIYSVYHIAGIRGVNIFGGLFSGIIFFLLYKLIKLRTHSPLLGVILGIIGVLGINPYMSPRPQAFSYCLLLLLMIAMEKKTWWAAIPITILGANLHGGFYPMYVLVVAFYAWNKKPFLIVFTALSAAVNPYGFTMLMYPFKIQQYPYFNIYINEWKSTMMNIPSSYFYFATYVILLLLLMRQKIKWTDGLFALLIAIQTFMAFRNLVFLYLIIIPILSPYINQRIVNIYKKLSEMMHQEIREKVICIFLMISGAFYVGLSFSNYNKTAYIAGNYPSGAISYLKEHNISYFFNMYGDGGYLIFNNMRPIIDGRADIYIPYYNDTDFFYEYMQAIYLNKDPQEFLNKYNIHYLLVDRSFPFSKFIIATNKCRILYEDQYYQVLEYNNLATEYK